MRITCWGTPRG
uniref:Uncharacterized protein n=1 Tax=Rhizophora mucronata TaxID=61149 RepID=A0A2P2R079_RHIMU